MSGDLTPFGLPNEPDALQDLVIEAMLAKNRGEVFDEERVELAATALVMLGWVTRGMDPHHAVELLSREHRVKVTYQMAGGIEKLELDVQFRDGAT